MMMKVVLLLVTLSMPTVYTQCAEAADAIEAMCEANNPDPAPETLVDVCAAIDWAMHHRRLPVDTCSCPIVWSLLFEGPNVEDGSKIPFIEQCLECYDVEIALQKQDSGCRCSASKQFLINDEDNGCVECDDARKLKDDKGCTCKEMGCATRHHDRCYLQAPTYSRDDDSWHYGYEPYGTAESMTDEYGFSGYDGSRGYSGDSYSSSEYDLPCSYVQVADYYHMGATDGAPPPCDCPRSYQTEYKTMTSKYDALYSACNSEASKKVYDDDSAASTATSIEKTSDKTVETVGWVLIAISGVLFLASIAFFMAGRSERKAAVQNQMARHGVLA